MTHSRVRRRSTRDRREDVFDPLREYLPWQSPAEEHAYWPLHREDWIADHESRRPGQMPEPLWRIEARTLIADDPSEPIDWRDWLDDDHHINAETRDHLARSRRLAERRALSLSAGRTWTGRFGPMPPTTTAGGPIAGSTSRRRSPKLRTPCPSARRTSAGATCSAASSEYYGRAA